MLALKIVIVVVVGYLLGNLNGAILISKIVNKQDVRQKGSGNAGLTNYVRNYGLKTSGMVLLIDFLKTCLGALLGWWLLGAEGYAMEGSALGGLAASLGHDFPAFFGFKGGKGIVCGAAVALCVDWRAFVIVIACFIVLFLLTHYVSFSSMCQAVLLPVLVALFHPDRPWVIALVICTGALALFQHRANFVRLVKGQESKMYLGKKKK